MQSDGSLPFSQNLVTGFYPESEKSSPHPASLFLKIRFNIILPY
jgi:hypothetical protein